MKRAVELRYQGGFDKTFSSEAAKGALPVGRNSAQRPLKGLYAEGISGTAFTVPRAENRGWITRSSSASSPARATGSAGRSRSAMRRIPTGPWRRW
jgi:homogentisate 1,2-dioxygenase